MKNKSPLVSIGMPVYNGGRFLSEALDSLLNQDFQNFELIISDNASTDNTAEICKRYLKKDNRIKYYRNEVNIGAAANFNKVVEYASAPYFMWAAYDDLWEPSYISELVKVLEFDKSTVLAFSDFDAIDEKGRQIERYPEVLKLSSSSETIFKRICRFTLLKGMHGRANLIYGLMRTHILKEIGGIVDFGRGDYAIDDLTLFLILFRGNFYIITNKLLFHKRIVSTGDKQPNEYTICEYFIKIRRFIHNIYEHLIEIHGYFFGYRRIIATSRLPLHQKIILYFLTILQELKWLIRAVFETLKGFIYHAARIMLYKLTKLI